MTETNTVSPLRQRMIEDMAARKLNPNGSEDNIAGVFNSRFNVLGLMPHPENLIDPLAGGVDGWPLFDGSGGVSGGLSTASLNAASLCASLLAFATHSLHASRQWTAEYETPDQARFVRRSRA
jgi:CobB/CobQ-like glutamine amidotransferase domain